MLRYWFRGPRQNECRDHGPGYASQHSGRHLRCMACVHWFRQCTRPIHSAHKRKPQPNIRGVRRRTSNVRRQSAARRSCSPKQPPLATSLPAKEAGAHGERDDISPDGSSVIIDLKPLSPFVPAHRDITPESLQTGRDCLAAHAPSHWYCEERVRAFARTPLVLPHKFYSGHSPTLRLLAVRPPASWSARLRCPLVVHVVRYPGTAEQRRLLPHD